MKKLLTITLTLAMFLAFTVPTSASEETDISSVPGQEETVPPQPPEDIQPEEVPDTPEESPDIPEGTPDIPEGTPDIPEGTPDIPEGTPDVPEGTPDVPEGTPDIPEGTPDVPEGTPDTPEESPDAPENPGIPGENPDIPEEIPEPLDEPDIINVLVPPSGNVVINPYHMPVSTSYGVSTDQIVHEPQALESITGFPVRVSVQAVGTIQPWSTAYFISTPPAEDALDKQIFLYVEFQNDPNVWSGFYSDGPNQLLVTDWNAGKENVLTLEPFSAGYFRLSGAMAPFPEQMWSSDDTVDVTLAFTFSPVVEEAPLPAEEPAPFVPPVQEPEAFEEPSQDISPEPPAGLPAEPSEDVSAGPSEEPPAALPAEPPAEPSEVLPPDSPAPDTAVEEPGGSPDASPQPDAGGGPETTF